MPLVNSLSKSSYGQSDAYICKFNPDCNEIIFSTYFGGSKDDILTSAKLANDNGIFLTGYTNSNNLPVTGGAYQNNLKGKNDIFFAKISNTGQTVRTCTYIGGNEDDFSYTMCVTPSEYVYIGGATKSSDFPVYPVKVWYSGSYEYVFESPFDRTYNGNFDGVVIKFSAQVVLLNTFHFLVALQMTLLLLLDISVLMRRLFLQGKLSKNLRRLHSH